MSLTDRTIVLLNDGETWTNLAGCEVIVMSSDETFKRLAEGEDPIPGVGFGRDGDEKATIVNLTDLVTFARSRGFFDISV